MIDLIEQFGPRMLAGLVVTIELVVSSVAIGAVLSWPLAFAMRSRNRLLRRLANGYVAIFRGTPLLAQAYLVYFGMGTFRPELQAVGLWWIFRDAYMCALITFSLNTAAYQAEVLRGAMQAVPRGQFEALQSLGIGWWSGFFHVVAPQVLVLALRPLGNEFVLMLKGSAIAGIVTVEELMGASRMAFNLTFDIRVYLIAAVLYLIVVEASRALLRLAERRLTRHLPKLRTGEGLP